jgi:peptidoglycan/xylan/chitin deacetylase (PgdA/CDA1 family)
MKWKQSVLRIVSEVFSLCQKPLSPKLGLRILTYHSIGSSVFADQLNLNSVAVHQFIHNVNVISKFNTVALSSVQTTKSESALAITFDDGYADNLYIASPILVEKQIPFSVFVTSDFIKKKVKGFLTPAELKRLSMVPGAKIAAHSKSHCNLTLCGDRVLKAELEDSKKYLEDLIGMPIKEFAYPHGIADMRVRDAVQQAGYDVAVCSNFDINKPGRDKLMLNRCVILGTDNTRTFELKLSGAWDWYKWISIDPLSIKDARV